MDPKDETTDSRSDAPFVLPKHVLFARSLALVSGAVIGIAAGAAVFGSGCIQHCAGVCGSLGVQPLVDAQSDTLVEHPGDRADAGVDAHAREVQPDGPGGGPCPAPRFPADWLV